MIRVDYSLGSFIVDKGILITEENQLNQVFDSMDQTVYPENGEPDFVLAENLIKVIGTGKVVVRIPDQTNPEIVY